MLTAKVAITGPGGIAGDVQIVQGSTRPNDRIRVVNYVLVADSTIAIKFTKGTAGSSTDLTGPMKVTGGQPLVSGYGPVRGSGGGYDGHFDCDKGQDLNINLGAGSITVNGYVNYVYTN